jgi:hypothetical protein
MSLEAIISPCHVNANWSQLGKAGQFQAAVTTNFHSVIAFKR